MRIYNNRVISYFFWRFILRNPRLRIFLTNLLVADEDVNVALFGSSVCVNKRKEIGYINAYDSSKSSIVFRDESGSLINLALILEPTDTFVDIGANVGLYSSVISKLIYVYPQMNFYAFEANPDTARRLRKSLEGRNVKIYDFALSNKECELEFVQGATSGVFGAKNHASDFQVANNTQIIKAKTLDSVGIIGDSIILKIDVEGHEREVIEGATGLINDGRIKAIYLDGFNDEKLPDELKSKGFILFDGRTLKPLTVVQPSLLAIHKRYVV